MKPETKYRILADSNHDFGFWIDPQGQFIYASPSSKRVTGYEPKEFIDDPNLYLKIVHPDDLIILTGHIENDEKKHNSSEIEYRIFHADGSIRWVSHVCQHAYSDDGEYLGVRGSNRDITERKQLEEEIENARIEMELLNQERMADVQKLNEKLRAENDERLKMEIQLRESENRLRELSTSLLNAQETERKLIAREIHDSLGSILAGTKFKVEIALNELNGNNPKARAALEGVIPIIKLAVDESRRIQMSLRPSLLDDLGILATIDWFCRQFESTYPNIRISKKISIQENEIPEPLKIVIYRILQEGLNNVAKHSKANVVIIYLRRIGQQIQLVIQDSGQGFNLEEISSRKGINKGFGLNSMRERTELSGGNFLIQSGKGAGTLIRANWLLDN